MIPPGKSMDTMLAEGEIPAMINPYIPRPIVSGDARVTRLFPDYRKSSVITFGKTGIFPIMHVTVIKQEIVDKYPLGGCEWLGEGLREGQASLLSTGGEPENCPLAWFSHQWNAKSVRFWAPIPGPTVSAKRTEKSRDHHALLPSTGPGRQRNAYRRSCSSIPTLAMPAATKVTINSKR